MLVNKTMANKNRNINNKRGVTKKSSFGKNLLDQKENWPKETKVGDVHNSDNVTSTPLNMKKSVRNSVSAKRKSAVRILPNGKLMPSLVDLEKMYEDSDDDTDDEKTTNTHTEKPDAKESQEVSAIINTGSLSWLPTHSKVTDQNQEISNKPMSHINHTHSDDTISLPPPSKKLRLKTLDDEYDDLPPVIITPKKNLMEIYTTNLQTNPIESCLNNLTQISSQQETDNITTEVSNNRKTHIEYDEHLSDCSSDSNKTVQYNLPAYLSQKEPVSQTFSPLPSTSKDNKTFIKNDELFNAKLKEINNNLSKETDTSVPIENPFENVKTCEDLKIEEPSENVKEECVTDIEIIDSTDQNCVSDTPTPKCVDDDDDCIIIEPITTTQKVSKEPDIIDLEYDFVNTDMNNFDNCKNDTVDDEIIDVDALIAQNQSILNKYKKPDLQKSEHPNLVIDVDVSTIAESVMAKPSIQNQTNNYDPEVVIVSEPTTDEIGNRCRIGSVQKTSNGKKRIKQTYNQNPNHTSGLPNTNRILISEGVTNFFRDIYRPHGNQTTINHVPIFHPILNILGNLPLLSNHFSEDNVTVVVSENHSSPYQSTQNKQTRKKYTSKKKCNNGPPSSPESPPPSKSSGNLGECPICMDKLSAKVIASTICGHLFCMSCLEKAVKTSKRCPTCRKLLKNKGYHQIYL